MADSDWAGRGFTRPGPQGEDDGRDPQSPTAPDTSKGLPPEITSSMGDWARRRSQREVCPLHLWGGYGHSEPFRGCPGDRELEAG
jgi:hypothetical protein